MVSPRLATEHLGPKGSAALTRVLSAIEGGALLPSSNPSGLSPVIVPTIELAPYLCEIDLRSDSADPGGAGSYTVFTVPIGEQWEIKHFRFSSSNSTIDQVKLEDPSGQGTTLETQTAATSWLWYWPGPGELVLPGGWKFVINIAAHTAETSTMVTLVKRCPMLTPGVV